ncbi:Cyanophycin synthetase [Hartmannibacter diazotrophicus]|uniref:Cyanophycin synthetase n=1 Tax=Hartmannibacter diazotrophicus TaxID=1482074 RepID=A0A2C9DD96_9HYPH|nr:N-acetylglutaminylglutamine synthetase [Hartmannibacter diazotrophicus]SON58294.1 Cyanophycin synthetase [Hartmannibacter diazotrophicus]
MTTTTSTGSADRAGVGAHGDAQLAQNARAIVDCGWGRLVFGQTFADAADLVDAMREEAPGRRDIAFYIADPHVVLAGAPHELFLDPSHTFRLDLATYRPPEMKSPNFTIRPYRGATDAEALNRIYGARHMVTIAPHEFERMSDDPAIEVLVAENTADGTVVGGVMGIDHVRAFSDPEGGSSLWCLAVDPQASVPGIGVGLVHALSSLFATRGARFMDLSVIHDNAEAIALYEKLGFERVPLFTLKRKNSFNEKLFVGPAPEERLNPYARLIVDEARRRGIDVEVLDADGGFFRLSYGGRSITCRESLTELTSAIAMAICDDKAVTRRVVERAGVKVPAQIESDDAEQLAAFLADHGSLVVKPARGEQGRGIAVGIETPEALAAAIEDARGICERVIIESCHQGEDLRLIVIGYKLVAAAVRRPARVIGDGKRTIRELIERQSRRREAATGGESSIPVDSETERCLAKKGYTLDDVPEEGLEVVVRGTANLHTGGTIHDVTDIVHPVLVDAAIKAAKAIQIPVVGIDFLVKSPDRPDYVFIEANERPGLANHEPQPTAERFIDLLFPQTMPAVARLASQAVARG